MKLVALIMISGAMLALGACGDDESDAGADGQQAVEGQARAPDAKPEVEPPSGPPPKEVVVEDLKEGTGPAAKLGDEARVRFVAVNHSGVEIYDTWTGDEPPVGIELGSGAYGSPWEKSLVGMKAGGEREVQIPPGKAYQVPGALYYWVELVELEPG